MGQACKIDRPVASPTIDASKIAERVMQFAPASEAEAIKLLRASFADCPLGMRVAVLELLVRGWPRKLKERYNPR